jgi:gluconate 5-dehydrogenase
MTKKIFDLTGKVALVTGATQGLGYAIAKGLAQHGATLAISARNPEKLEEALNRLKNHGLDAYGYLFDVTDSEEVTIGIDAMEYELGKIDILVNNAGIMRRHTMENFPEKDWNEMIDTNLSSVYKVSNQVAKAMIERKSGKIINICSLMSEVGRNSTAAYAAAKGGVKMLTKAMATEWAKYNIQVNGIGPGYFETEMTDALKKDEKFNNWLCERTPAGRWGKPEELVGAAVFLASDASNFVNGQIIYVDGGILASL